MVKKALKVLNKIELLVIYITFGGMIFAAFAQVIFRLILKKPIGVERRSLQILFCVAGVPWRRLGGFWRCAFQS